MATIFLFKDEFILSEDPELKKFYGIPVTPLGQAERHELEDEGLKYSIKQDKPCLGVLTSLKANNQWLLSKAWFKYQVDWKRVKGEPIPGTSLIQIEACSGPELDCIITCVAINPSAGPVDSFVTNRWVSNKNDIPNWHKRLQASYGYRSP